MTQSVPSTITAATFPVPQLNPEAFARATIGGVLTPGAIPKGGVADWAIISDWDVKKGKGQKDAIITDKGDPPPTGKIKYQVWRYGVNGDPNDFADDEAFVLMMLAARKNKQALDIVHPIVNQLEVTSVVAKSIGQLVDESGGLWTRTIEFLKWVPQTTDAGGTPTTANDKNQNDPNATQEQQTNDPNAALKQEFSDKLNEAAQ